MFSSRPLSEGINRMSLAQLGLGLNIKQAIRAKPTLAVAFGLNGNKQLMLGLINWVYPTNRTK